MTGQEILDTLQSLPAGGVIGIIWYLKRQAAKIEESISKVDLDKSISDIKGIIDKTIIKMEVLTENGIKSGENSRKELWIELRRLSNEVAGIEGYLSHTNGYKKGDKN